MNRPLLDLHGLAADAGVRTAYRDMHGTLRVSSPEALLAVLRSLGIDLPDAAHAADARRALAADRPDVEPVIVAWNGRLASPLRIPTTRSGPVEVVVTDEAGVSDAVAADLVTSPGSTRLELRDPLPAGLLTLRLEGHAGVRETFVISAPDRATPPPAHRTWGAFAPLHAFGPSECVPMSYLDLADAAARLGELGGEFLGTLPLLAAFLDQPFDPSPYAPASRLFWNELFIGFDRTWPPAPARGAPLFDYAAAAARQRPHLQAAADAFFASDGDRQPAYRAFLADYPQAGAYARFRAACDGFAAPFGAWPATARTGSLAEHEVNPADVRRHLFGAWRADRQLADVAAAARAGSAAALYIDLPLGVHDQGFDVWQWPDLFAPGVSAGAPPDALFRGGQNWGFRPLSPAALRGSRYDYLIRVLRHHMRHAGALRIDHVMSLVRLFWIPGGFPATEGVYVAYPRDELLALLVLESGRTGTLLIGEDLGTVPEEVRAAMRARGLLRMFVLQFALGGTALPAVPPHAAASLDTHDTPTFAGFWRGIDIEEQRELGLLDDARTAAATSSRARLRARIARALAVPVSDEAAILHGLHRHLAASRADLLLITLEDLWREPLPQNVPGTHDERPNWRRRARIHIRQALHDPDVVRMLRELDHLRSAESFDARA